MTTKRGTTRKKAADPVSDETFEEGSGNVFADLGLPDAEELQAKANLVHVIINVIEDKGWTQRKAATVLGVAESEVSDIMNGKLHRFSRERLERYLNALGMDIRIQVFPRAAGKRRSGVTVQLLSSAARR
jgi:predicted XRE-type DNA-binding protein